MAISNFPIKGGVLVSDRNFTNGNASWRYRNKLNLQKTISVHSYHPSPYASAEFYYNSKFGKWSATTVYAGAIFPLGTKMEIDPYYEHANSTGKRPNVQTNAFGLILNLFFRSEKIA
jgi:hypothetical protein